MSKSIIYCIPGLGADERIFSRLAVQGMELKHISWLTPQKNEQLESYAARMAASINEKNAILLGVSFGGMVGIEIAKHISLRKIFIVSSIKSVIELPSWMRVSGRLKLNRLLPSRFYRLDSALHNHRLGATSPEEKQIVSAYRGSADFQHVDWAIDRILNWKNRWVPSCLVHIHGNKDKIFPVANIKADYVVDGATHFMIFNRAKEISGFISHELQK